MENRIERKTLLNSIAVALLFAANALTWVLSINNAIVMIMAFIVQSLADFIRKEAREDENY